MEIVEININGIRFKAPTEWLFFPFGDFVLAKCDSQQGIFKFAAAGSPGIPNPAANDFLQMAERFVRKQKMPPAFDVREPYSGANFFGAASYKIRRKNRYFLTRVYYLYRDGNLFLATYGCPWRSRNDEQVRKELSQCERMILTMQTGG